MNVKKVEISCNYSRLYTKKMSGPVVLLDDIYLK